MNSPETVANRASQDLANPDFANADLAEPGAADASAAFPAAASANPPAELPQRLVFIDLETTGADPARDRIIEIGLVTVEDGVTRRWASFVNPGRVIPPFIQRLTGIDDSMVDDAPTFEQLAKELRTRLHGRLFVAHNARFDYGFVRAEFRRLGQTFRADVLCTVRLSRKLYPAHFKHGLDSLIARHGLNPGERHRALADADAIAQFWHIVCAERPAAAIIEAVVAQLQRPSLPPQLAPDCLDDLPESPGVYSFYGDNGALLYVGKSVNLRQRVMAHFSASSREAREFRIAQEISRLDWIETAGELGALLLESHEIKDRQPIHNRQLRRAAECCAWRLDDRGDGHFVPELVCGEEADPGRAGALYGLFQTRREATNTLKKIADAYQLCHATLGLEKTTKRGAACFAHQLKKCKGACVGKEPLALHSARMMAALAKLRLKAWPYPGAVALIERNDFLDREDWHVVDGWRYLGSARSEADAWALLESARSVAFDADTYRLLKGEFGKAKLRVVRLAREA